MASFQQMGHNSHNLLGEKPLGSYRGAILSPVNYEEGQVTSLVQAKPRADFEMIFDPQLYYPHTERGTLPGWKYFPSDVDTADLTSDEWWGGIVEQLAQTATRIHCSSVCSPAIVPRIYSPDYYVFNRKVATNLHGKLNAGGIATLQTILVNMDWLSADNSSAEIASIATAGPIERAYLVFVTDLHPRREITQTEELIGAMRLIRFLEAAGAKVLVGFSSSDLLLWKAAGASDCATGKFFNLRRFTPARWEEPPEGGGQLSYWFEESLFSFLRESDLIRVRKAGYLSDASKGNPYSLKILEQIDVAQGQAWLADSWRQYMYWFADFEARAASNPDIIDKALIEADSNWGKLDELRVLMEERQNDGSWIRMWRRALTESAAS